jgi:hypothetical protein
MSQNFDYYYRVKGNFYQIRQKGMTCWAAAAAIMHSWNRGKHLTMDETLKSAGNRVDGPSYAQWAGKGKALPLNEMGSLGLALGMNTQSLRSFTDTQLFNLMSSRNTPLMVGFLGSGDAIAHFVVIREMSSSNGIVNVRMYDPNEEEGDTENSFQLLYQDMERLISDTQTYYQILHY